MAQWLGVSTIPGIGEVMQSFAGLFNGLLYRPEVRVFLAVLCGIFAGYTMLPEPMLLKELFQKSQAFKFIVLVLIGTLLYSWVGEGTLNADSLTWIFFTAIGILVLFEFLRFVGKKTCICEVGEVCMLDGKPRVASP